jgi:hypothetical protein
LTSAGTLADTLFCTLLKKEISNKTQKPMKNLPVIAISLMMLLSIQVIAQKTWTGATSTAWGTPSNWSPSGVPSASDYVTIPSAPSNQPVLSGASGTCSTLNIAAGASLSISATTTNNAAMTVTLNSLINGTLSIGGSVSKTGKLITKNINWLSGSSITSYLNSSMEVTGHWWFSSGSNVAMGFCSVQMAGSDNVEIHSFSGTSSFNSLTLNKTSPATVTLDPASTTNLTINSTLTINTGNSLISAAPITTSFKGNITNSGSLSFNAGTQAFEKASGTQLIQLNATDYFNDVTINSGGTVQLTAGSNMTVKGHLTISSGVFDPANNTISVEKNWTNSIGTASFIEGTGRVIFNGGNYHQYCSNETFNILEVNKPLGGAFRMNGTTVTCSSYDWTAGVVDVLASGTFTALDLADDGLWGGYYVNPGCAINLYQDAAQRVDLGGDLTFTNGGTINVYGGSLHSTWPLVNNASITMNGGTLDFKNQGILIYALGGVSLTTNITGGTIRTPGFFFSGRSDFNPSGGTVELYGNVDDNLQMAAGSLYDLKINKGSSNTITVLDDLLVNGSLQVANGTLKASGMAINTAGNVTIDAGGTFWLENGAQLKIGSSKILTVNNGGTFKTIGTAGSPNLISRLNASSNRHEIQVHGTIAAKYTTFEYNFGLNIWSDATIDPLYPFDNCSFQYGVDRYMLINNSQELMIRNANFPTSATGENVWKNNNAGRVNFRDAIGIYSGASFELDPYNRIDWTTSQPGLWTGAVSTDWHTAGNWDDLNVPTSTTSVTIPSGLTNMPVVSTATANCNSLNINGTLTIQDRTLNVAGNLKVNGSLAMNHYSGLLEVQGSIQWYSGSTANISANANIFAHGNWTFSSGSNAILENGSVLFKGSASRNIYTYSTTSSFNDLYIEKTAGNVTWSSSSTEPLRAKGFYVSNNNSFISNAAEDLIVTGNFYSFGSMAFNSGAVVFDGVDQLIIPNVNDYLNHVVFNQSGTITINQTNYNTLTLKGDLTLNSGVFSPGNSIIKIDGNWTNNSGTATFAEGTSRVIFNGGNAQFCNTEQFNILEVNKNNNLLFFQDSDIISCQTYDWTNGGVWVAGDASFIANDLADPGISGLMYLYDGTIEFHQDAAQRMDLIGDLTITGGEFKVYGGNDQSQWGQIANASLTMSGGILDFVDKAIAIQDNAPYTFTSTITGGIIRTQSGFLAQSPGFTPTGGTVYVYGAGNSMIVSDNGSAFYNLTIHKPNYLNRASILTTIIKNNFIIEEGFADIAVGWEIECWNNLEVQDGGSLSIGSGTVKMKNLASINVYQGGSLLTLGYAAAYSRICGISPTDCYTLTFHSGSLVEAIYTIFENLPEQGIYFAPGSLAGQTNTFKNCIFRNGKSGPNTLLTIDNEQDLVIENASFPTNTWGGQYNVRKTVNAGSVTFVNSTGAFSGEAFDDDPYNRIHWISHRQLSLSSVFLQGLYDGGGVMHQAQDENGAHWPAGIADMIWVELHNASNYGAIVYTAAYVQLSTNGTATISVPAIYTGSYYVTIRHRNGIETTTATPLIFSGPTLSYSFDLPGKAYGSNLYQTGDGSYVIYGGDVNQDGLIDSSDLIAADNDVSNFTTGYIPTDINGDGLIDSTDMILIENNASNFIGIILP